MKIIYSGEKTGNVQISLDGGATWSETMTLETLKTEGFHIENDSQDFEKIKIKNSAGTAVDVVNVVSSIKNNDAIEPEYITGLVIKSIYDTNIKNTYPNLTSITIPEGTTEIESYAFSGCSNLIKIIIPASVITIGENAFASCTNLTDIYYNGTQEQWENVSKGENWNNECPAVIHF